MVDLEIETIPELLAWVKASKGWDSERRLAKWVGRSNQTVNTWVNGNGTPDPQSCWKIADLITGERDDAMILQIMRIAGHLPPPTYHARRR